MFLGNFWFYDQQISFLVHIYYNIFQFKIYENGVENGLGKTYNAHAFLNVLSL